MSVLAHDRQSAGGQAGVSLVNPLDHQSGLKLGMPQLCRAGLNENWVWKECGHRHWLALAEAFGMDRPDFRDAQGDRLYPAFTMISFRNVRFGGAREDQYLDFDVKMARISKTQFRSRIIVTLDLQPIAEVEMTSIFLRRAIPGRNGSVERAFVQNPCALALNGVRDTKAHALRNGAWDAHMGFRREERARLDGFAFDPSPHDEFNGADFLYFASFQSALDRAEWAWFRRDEPLLTTVHRDIVYQGNVELGDRLELNLCGLVEERDRLTHWIEILRASDGARIAEAMTVRAPRKAT